MWSQTVARIFVFEVRGSFRESHFSFAALQAYVARRLLPCGLRPRNARPWLRAGVIGGGSTGVSSPVVAFATIRDPPG